MKHGAQQGRKPWERPSANLEDPPIVQLYGGMMRNTQAALYPGLNYLV